MSRRIYSALAGRVALNLIVLSVLAVLTLPACGSPSPSNPSANTPSSSPTASSTPSSTGSNTKADCSSQAILSALPSGATMQRFDCATVNGTEWAAARVNPGNTVFFLQWDGTKWNAEDSDSVCGTASAGLPPSLLAYCEATASSSSPSSSPSTSPQSPATPANVTCTSEEILAALPGGATMKEFTCANVGGQKWAAARVDPGDTAFFLQWDGTKWNAQESDSVCGTASAGLPQSLLAYCK